MEGMGSCISLKVESLFPLKVSGVTFSEGKTISEWVDFLLKMEKGLVVNATCVGSVEKGRKEE